MELSDSLEQTLLDMVKPVIIEDVVAVQRFIPGNRLNRPDPLHVGRLVRKLLGRGRLDDKLWTFENVLAVTPTRVVVFGASTRTGRFALTRQFAEWPRAQIKTTAEEVKFVTGGGSEGQSFHRQQMLRLTMHTPKGTFIADMEEGPAYPLTQRISRELADQS